MSNTQSTKQEFKGELSTKKSMIEKKRNYPLAALLVRSLAGRKGIFSLLSLSSIAGTGQFRSMLAPESILCESASGEQHIIRGDPSICWGGKDYWGERKNERKSQREPNFFRETAFYV
jgi:hypothetical protein